MRRFLALLLTVFALSLSLTACGTPSQDPSIQKNGSAGK